MPGPSYRVGARIKVSYTYDFFSGSGQGILHFYSEIEDYTINLKILMLEVLNVRLSRLIHNLALPFDFRHDLVYKLYLSHPV